MGRDLPVTEHAANDVAFSEFYRDRYQPMVRLAVLLIDRLDLAEETVQDCFAALYRRWGAVAEPAAYLRRSVVNGCRDTLRRRRLAGRQRGLEAPEGVVLPVDHLGDVIAGLGPAHRTVVVLRFYEAMTIDEIAAATGAAPGTIKSQLHRALRRLRKELEP